MDSPCKLEKPYTLFVLARTVLSHHLWGTCEQIGEVSLAQHLQATKNKIPSLGLPTFLSSSLKEGLSLLEKGYNEAYDWKRIYEPDIIETCHGMLAYEDNISDEVIIPVDDRYHFSKFITPDGYFNDINWVTQYVDDPTLNALQRFAFGMFYCLENRAQALLEEKFKSGGNIINIFPNTSDMYSEYITLKRFNPTNAIHCFLRAVRSGHERAAEYFWNELSQAERNVTQDNMPYYASLIREANSNGYHKIVHFLYSKLNLDQQSRFLQFYVQFSPFIWKHFINCALIRYMPQEIVRHQTSLPPRVYTDFLTDLIIKINFVKNPLYQEIFRTVWKIGSAGNKRHFIQNELLAVSSLLQSKDFISTRLVLQQASFQQKKKLLFATMEDLLLNDPSFRRDSCAIQNYLLLFITDLQNEDAASNLSSFLPFSLHLLGKIKKEIYSKNNPSVEVFKDITLPVIEALIFEIRVVRKAFGRKMIYKVLNEPFKRRKMPRRNRK